MDQELLDALAEYTNPSFGLAGLEGGSFDCGPQAIAALLRTWGVSCDFPTLLAVSVANGKRIPGHLPAQPGTNNQDCINCKIGSWVRVYAQVYCPQFVITPWPTVYPYTSPVQPRPTQ